MKYKLIAMDFDGTLLTPNKQITSYTKEVLRKCKEKGYIITGVTARNLGSAKNVSDINMFDYLILNNGSYVYDVKNNKGGCKAVIAKKDYTIITRTIENISSSIEYCSPSLYYVYKNSPKNESIFIKKIENFEDIEEDIVRMNIYLLENSKIEYYCNLINNKYETISCFIMQDSDNDKKWLNINPKGINKSVILEQLGKELNINLKEMIFFGDGPNDLEVMQSVGYSVAMGNALEEVKAIADSITLSNTEDGVAVFLEKFLNNEIRKQKE